MTKSDRMFDGLSDEAGYGQVQVDDLVARLTRERSPRQSARRQLAIASLACIAAASASGLVVGAAVELNREPQLAALLPAGTSGSPLSLIDG
jgi:hypothetical protein